MQCSKLCGGGEMTRKVLCIMDNQTVPITECDADAVLDSSDSCNKQACGEGEDSGLRMPSGCHLSLVECYFIATA